jgi:hypothetical protein
MTNNHERDYKPRFSISRGRALFEVGTLTRYVGFEVMAFYHTDWGRAQISVGLWFGFAVFVHVKPA